MSVPRNDYLDEDMPDDAESGRVHVYHRRNIQNPKPKEECMGIKVNIWNRAKIRRYYLEEFRSI